MKARFALFFFSCLVCSSNAMSDTQLDRFAKDQQRNDSNMLRENKIAKKDVFSSNRELIIDNIQIPYDKVCYQIDKLVLKNDFLNDRKINQIKKKVAGKCLGVKGIRSVATLVQDYFINTGYVTTRIEMHNQDLTSRKLLLNIVPGRIERIHVDSNEVKDFILPFKKMIF